MRDDEDLRETLIAAETCIRIAIRQTADSTGPADEAISDFRAAIWNLRKWRLALEAGVWTDQQPGTPGEVPRSARPEPGDRPDPANAYADELTDHSRAGVA